MIILTECWLGDLPVIKKIHGYTSYHTNKYSNQNGGIIVYVKDVWGCSVLEPNLSDANCLSISLTNNFTLLAIYRSPSVSNLARFNDSLNTLLDEIIKNDNQNIIVAGDININIINDKNDAQINEYICLVAEHGLISSITLPTRDEKCLDHILIKSKFESVGIVYSSSITDHNITMAGFKSKSKQKVLKRAITKTNFASVATHLESIDWSPVLNEYDTNLATNTFSNILSDIIENHTETVNIPSSKQILKPWITPGLIRCIRHRDRLHLKCRKNPKNMTARLIYERYRNFSTDLLHKIKANYESTILNKNLNNPKGLWKAIKEICEITPTKSNIPSELLEMKDSPLESVNECNKYFATVGKNLSKDILTKIKKTEKSLASTARNLKPPSQSFFMHSTDEVEILNLIEALKTEKAPGIDGIGTALIKHISPNITKILCHIFNLSLQNGIFPDLWKTAAVVPIHKKGDKKDPSNYRPISLLPIFSKLLEKIVNSRLIKYLEMNNFLSSVQFGFRRGRSTEDASSLLIDTIVTHLDSGSSCIGVFLDLSKAFDTVSPVLLLQKLENIGIRGVALLWFRSYLTDRFLRTKVGDFTSEPSTVIYGVPQGSILGPLLFILYINDIVSTIEPSANMEIVCYADDTAIIFHGNDWDYAMAEANRGLRNISTWLANNLLTLNTSKTEFVCFHKTAASNPPTSFPSAIQIHTCKEDTVTCTCDTIKRVDSVKYLGIILDENLNFYKHILHLSKRARKLINIMRLLRNNAPKQILKQVYIALCESLLSYCICCWGGSAKTYMAVLERAQRAILKVMLKKRRRFSTNLLYKEAEVLSIRKLFILRTTLSQHHKTLKSLEYTSLLTKRLFSIKVHKVNSAFGQRFTHFLQPFLYNKIVKFCKINQSSGYEAKLKITSWLLNLDYEDTESLLQTVT